MIRSLTEAEAADAADPFRAFRTCFRLPEGVIYLDGNSLGVLPRATPTRLAEVIEQEWGRDLVGSWNSHDWIGAPSRVGDKIGRLIGAQPGETIVADSTSVCLFKLLAAALKAVGRGEILTEFGNFPTDLHVANGLAALAVGCGYKYLNGSPGAPAFLYARRDWQSRLANPIAGWLGHARPFDFEDLYEPARGIERFRSGTPPILGLLALEAGVDLMLEADPKTLWEKSCALFELFTARVAASCPELRLVSPTDPARRGSHISFAHGHAFAIVQALVARGVIGDFRAPDVLRFGLTPMYLGYADVWRAVETIAAVLASGEWQEARFRTRGRVT